MGDFGQLFFSQFVDLVWDYSLPLTALLSMFVIRELRTLHLHDRWRAVLMFSFFFLVISTHWFIKPVKKALLVGHYKVAGLDLFGWHLDAAQVELVAKVLNMVVALLAAFLFARLSSRLKREKLVLYLTALFALGFLIFSQLLHKAGSFSVWMFYLYGDLFTTLMVAGFFAFLNDSTDIYDASRIYGLIGLGGVLGGFFGSVVMAGYARKFEPSVAAIGSIAPLLTIALIAWWVGTIVRRKPPSGPLAAMLESNAAFNGGEMKAILRSRYLMGIALIVGAYEMVSSIMDYQFTTTVLHFVPGEHLKSHFANVFSFTNFVSLLLQLFLTRFAIVNYGAPRALFFLPVSVMLGEAAFTVLPGLLLGSMLNTMDNAFNYSINQSAKEILYIPLGREEKYRAKAFIDVFVVRSAKAVAVVFSLAVTALFIGFENLRWLSLIAFVILLIWLAVIQYLVQRFETIHIRRE